MSKITELFGYYTKDPKVDWKKVVSEQVDKYTGKRSIKVRKSQPEISIGTVVVKNGKKSENVIIDPTRFLEKGKVFLDCIHLLTNHEPGNELHLIPEIRVPGGNVDFFLVSTRKGKVQDFVGIELQSLDTTGTLWQERQKFLQEKGLIPATEEVKGGTYGINWKMTAKTTLVQIHHKLETFEHLNKHFVLILQDKLLDYMMRDFNFQDFNEPARTGDYLHIHAYEYIEDQKRLKTSIELARRISSDAAGVAASLGLKADAKVEMEIMIKRIESKISDKTLFNPAKV